MEWVTGFVDKTLFWGSIAGGVALIGGGAFVARAVHQDATVLASDVQAIIMRENRHRARLVRLMERAETRAAPVILALLEDVRVALANRVDCGSIAKDLVSATQALRAAEPESEQASSCQQRVAVLWAALINSALTQVLAGVYLGTLSRAAVRVTLAVRAAEEARMLTAAARDAHRVPSGAAAGKPATRVWDETLGAAVTEALLGKVHAWMVGQGTARVVDACRAAVRQSCAQTGGIWAGLAGGGRGGAAVGPAASSPATLTPQTSPVSLSTLRTVLRRAADTLDGTGSGAMAVTRAWLPRPDECASDAGPLDLSGLRRESLMDESLTPSRSKAPSTHAGSDAGTSTGAPAEESLGRVPSSVAFGASRAADELLLIVWDVLDSPQFELAASPAVSAAHHRLRPALRAAAEAAQAADSTSKSAGAAAGADPTARLGLLARKLVSDVDSVAAAAAAGVVARPRSRGGVAAGTPPSSSSSSSSSSLGVGAGAAAGGSEDGEGAAASDAVLVCLARRVFAELTGAHEAATAGVAGPATGSDEAALNALLARVLADTSKAPPPALAAGGGSSGEGH